MTDTVLGYVIGLFFNIFLVTLSWSHQEASTRRFQRTSARPPAFNKQYFQIIKKEWLQLVLTKWLSFIWNVFFGFDLTQVFFHQYGMITRTDRGANNPWQHYKLMGLVYRSFTGVDLYLNSHLAAGSMKPRFNMDWFSNDTDWSVCWPDCDERQPYRLWAGEIRWPAVLTWFSQPHATWNSKDVDSSGPLIAVWTSDVIDEVVSSVFWP